MPTSTPTLNLLPSPSTTTFDAQLKITKVPEIILNGKIVHGFKRGSRLLGCPTANIDPAVFTPQIHDAQRGVYIGYVRFLKSPPSAASSNDVTVSSNVPTESRGESTDFDSSVVYRTVLSIGTNPTFETTSDTVECYILHSFPNDFYDAMVSLLIVGYLRPQEKFTTLEELIQWIERDIRVGGQALNTNDYKVEIDHWCKGIQYTISST